MWIEETRTKSSIKYKYYLCDYIKDTPLHDVKAITIEDIELIKKPMTMQELDKKQSKFLDHEELKTALYHNIGKGKPLAVALLKKIYSVRYVPLKLV